MCVSETSVLKRVRQQVRVAGHEHFRWSVANSSYLVQVFRLLKVLTLEDLKLQTCM